MQLPTRIFTAALSTVLALMLFAGIASASRSIETNPGGSVNVASRLTFGNVERIGETRVRQRVACDITLLRTIGRSIPKTANTLFGNVTGVAIDRGTPAAPHCETALGTVEEVQVLTNETVGTHRELGSGVLLYTVTWLLNYDSFQGTLPSIEGINFHITGVQFRLTISGIRCLYGRPTESSFGLIEVRTNEITRATAVTNRTALERIEGSGILCPGPRGSFEGTFAVSPTQRIRLI